MRIGSGMVLWFWCVPRRRDSRAVQITLRPRHTPYEEAGRSIFARGADHVEAASRTLPSQGGMPAPDHSGTGSIDADILPLHLTLRGSLPKAWI